MRKGKPPAEFVIFQSLVAKPKDGDPGEDRTLNIQLRRLALYPIELRGRGLILPNYVAGTREFHDLAAKQTRFDFVWISGYSAASDFQSRSTFQSGRAM
jgi:hypothetical protein